jgi:hypothetical protein
MDPSWVTEDTTRMDSLLSMTAEPAAFTPQRSVTKALHGSSLWRWKHPTKNARASCLARKTYREKDLENNGFPRKMIYN